MNISAARAAKWIVGIYVTALLCVIGYALIRQPRLVYATPEGESAFLRNYTPNDTLKAFLPAPAIIGGGSYSTSGAGPDAPNYKSVFEPRFVMPSDDGPRLTAALVDGVSHAITSSGGRVTAMDGNYAQGYTFQYVDGRSTGTMTITPVHAVEGVHWPLRSGELVATVKVTIDETWVKSR